MIGLSRGMAQFGGALGLGPRGRRFESGYPDGHGDSQRQNFTQGVSPAKGPVRSEPHRIACIGYGGDAHLRRNSKSSRNKKDVRPPGDLTRFMRYVPEWLNGESIARDLNVSVQGSDVNAHGNILKSHTRMHHYMVGPVGSNPTISHLSGLLTSSTFRQLLSLHHWAGC